MLMSYRCLSLVIKSTIKNLKDITNFWYTNVEFRVFLEYIYYSSDIWLRVIRDAIREEESLNFPPLAQIIVDLHESEKLQICVNSEAELGILPLRIFTKHKYSEEFLMKIVEISTEFEFIQSKLLEIAFTNGYPNLAKQITGAKNFNGGNAGFPMVEVSLSSNRQDLFDLAKLFVNPSQYEINSAFALGRYWAMERFLKDGRLPDSDIHLIKYLLKCQDSVEIFGLLDLFRNYMDEGINMNVIHDYRFGNANLPEYAFLKNKHAFLEALTMYGYPMHTILNESKDYPILKSYMETNLFKPPRIKTFFERRVKNVSDLKKFYSDYPGEISFYLGNTVSFENIWLDAIKTLCIRNFEDMSLFDFAEQIVSLDKRGLLELNFMFPDGISITFNGGESFEKKFKNSFRTTEFIADVLDSCVDFENFRVLEKTLATKIVHPRNFYLIPKIISAKFDNLLEVTLKYIRPSETNFSQAFQMKYIFAVQKFEQFDFHDQNCFFSQFYSPNDDVSMFEHCVIMDVNKFRGNEIFSYLREIEEIFGKSIDNGKKYRFLKYTERMTIHEYISR